MMKILVCIKQVCDSESPIQIDDHARWIQTDAITGYKMNRLDEFAVEEAVLLKEAYPGSSIDPITVKARLPDATTAADGRADCFAIS